MIERTQQNLRRAPACPFSFVFTRKCNIVFTLYLFYCSFESTSLFGILGIYFVLSWYLFQGMTLLSHLLICSPPWFRWAHFPSHNYERLGWWWARVLTSSKSLSHTMRSIFIDYFFYFLLFFDVFIIEYYQNNHQLLTFPRKGANIASNKKISILKDPLFKTHVNLNF